MNESKRAFRGVDLGPENGSKLIKMFSTGSFNLGDESIKLSDCTQPTMSQANHIQTYVLGNP
jgi:hypothetical protein